MASRAIEHHTPAEIRDYLAFGLTAVADLEPPDDLRAALFTQAVALRSARTIMVDQPASQIFGPLPHMR